MGPLVEAPQGARETTQYFHPLHQPEVVEVVVEHLPKMVQQEALAVAVLLTQAQVELETKVVFRQQKVLTAVRIPLLATKRLVVVDQLVRERLVVAEPAMVEMERPQASQVRLSLGLAVAVEEQAQQRLLLERVELVGAVLVQAAHLPQLLEQSIRVAVAAVEATKRLQVQMVQQAALALSSSSM